jgi:hypothetical protein
MTTAVSEIFKQAKMLSAEEQSELAEMLIEQARLKAAISLDQIASHREASLDEDEDMGEPLDDLSLEFMPPKWTYTARAKFLYVGRGEPLAYDFSDFFDNESDSEG